MRRQSNLHWALRKPLVEATCPVRNALRRPFLFMLLVGGALSLIALTQCRPAVSESELLTIFQESRSGCSAPCWLGIVPGVSTESDFTAIVETTPSARFDDMKSRAYGLRFVQYTWRDRVAHSLMSLKLENDSASHVSIQTEPDITLQSAFEVLGAPQTYASFASIGEQPRISLYLFYESEGIVIETFIPQSEIPIIDCHFDLPPSTTIDQFYLIQPATAQEALDSLQGTLPSRLLIPHPWPGERNLELSICPPGIAS